MKKKDKIGGKDWGNITKEVYAIWNIILMITIVCNRNSKKASLHWIFTSFNAFSSLSWKGDLVYIYIKIWDFFIIIYICLCVFGMFLKQSFSCGVTMLWPL